MGMSATSILCLIACQLAEVNGSLYHRGTEERGKVQIISTRNVD